MAVTQNYVLGRGKLYFERFAENQTVGAGRYRYIGNTPSISMTAESETLDHFSSEAGLRVKDRSVTLQQDMSGNFTTDNIDRENLALLLQGDEGDDTIASASGLSDTFTSVEIGTYVQLGVTASKPEGVGNVTVVAAVVGSDTLAAGVDYDVDADTGMVYLRDDAVDLATGDNVTIHYSTAAGTRSRITDTGDEIYGALRYVSDNPVGDQRDKVWPYVKLTPSGDFQLKGDDWQTITFDFEVLRRNDATPRVVSLGRYA